MNKTLFSIRQQATKSNALDIYIYDDVEGDSYNWWTGEKTESETSANHIKQVLESNQNATEINLYVNSYGGEVKEGLGIYNQLKRHPAQVNVYIDGFACSIASVIAMAGDKVIMGTNALMMIHHASMGCFGNAEELRKAANDVEVIDQASCSSYLSKAGDKLDETTLKQLLDNQTWLNASQCLEYGLIDEIAGQEDKTIEAAQQRFKQSIQAQIMQVKEPSIDVPEKFATQKSNYELLRQKFMKKEGNN
ncbi:MAG: head maturation protease, ClpP-related [Clostridium butyricum]|uniref:head maturation protease, ClpP-related n=1 Tax=Clostridium TaxID=1485 RepID=UPI0008A54B7F|nr:MULTISPECIES: head maturation protease, ClpP-related [Clostridium]MCQ2014653.1 Clp protease ClpP [Clostridium butyricum]MCQ2026580.1 Clp protease ClpP [Clostridium butyricum]MDU0323841.1 Clp protease ClpP [Clostridium butyricum]MDU3087970.1 Clp protease ClpP [Clostridium sp.]MDU4658597.1 Clp protease ClpP [Clostridium butyricum]